MKTDKQLYQIFSLLPESLFDLVGISVTGKFHFQSVEIKEIARTMDGLLTPENQDDIHWVVEFQNQPDPTIYHRLVLEMASLALHDPEQKTYRGMIVFGERSFDPKTEMWSSFQQENGSIVVFYLDEIIENYGKNYPDSPLYAVLQPYLAKDQAELVKKAQHYYNQIHTSSLQDDVRSTLEEVFINWLQIRLKTKTAKEIIDMMYLTV